MILKMKLKRFYRFALASQPAFDVEGYIHPGSLREIALIDIRNQISPGVTFSDLPSTPIFTLGMDTPPSWIVSPRTSPYDLDNLVLGNIHDGAHVLFSLNQLLIEGHAREANNVPPRGLQLQLTMNGLGVASDTQVMANLGYLQFKATPGVYQLESVGDKGWSSQSVNETGPAVTLDSFEGKTILPRFERRSGMETANVLIEEEMATTMSLTGSILSRKAPI